MFEVAVLGSNGLIGRNLCRELTDRGYACHGIDLASSPEQDLRLQDCEPLKMILNRVDLVYFLAFDVGGSRYLAAKDHESSFLENNTRILVNTFTRIREHGVRTIFASSQMSHLPQTSYGLLKALGERFCTAVEGNSVRLWNVYGDEELGDKSHVIPDFIDMALSQGAIRMRTSGHEKRDFMHVADAARILADIGVQTADLLTPGEIVDVATCQWTSIREVAGLVANTTGATVIPGEGLDTFAGSDNHDPSPPAFVLSQEFIPIETGVRELVRAAAEQRMEEEVST